MRCTSRTSKDEESGWPDRTRLGKHEKEVEAEAVAQLHAEIRKVSKPTAEIGVLGHDLFLYPELSARQNLTFFAQLYGLDPAVIKPGITHRDVIAHWVSQGHVPGRTAEARWMITASVMDEVMQMRSPNVSVPLPPSTAADW